MEEDEKNVKISLSERVINSIFSIVALILLALTKILINFGVYSSIFAGIMSLLIISLAVVGALWSYIKCKKVTMELVFSAIVAFVCFICL